MKHIKLFENFDEKDGKNWKTAPIAIPRYVS
jgi:hypothetical protein